MRRGCTVAMLIGVAIAAAAPGRAGAELYRCKGPDGRTIFTDSRALCPGADAFEPRGALQEAPGPPPEAGSAGPASRLDRAEQRRLAEEAAQGEAARWRRKREQAERAIEALTARRAFLDQFVTACNRGRSVITRDDVGIKRTVSCDGLREEYAGLDEEQARLRRYLEEELPEECRRSGCLPGWLR